VVVGLRRAPAVREGEGQGGDQAGLCFAEGPPPWCVWAGLGRKTRACRPNSFLLITQVADPVEQ
jgi:hypothetical protein